MCSHCPHIALNGYMNLGHICMPALLDYVEFPTWWFKAITHRRHRSNVSSGYIRGVFYIHMDPPRLCCADFWDRLMSFSCADCNLSSFVASFFFFFFLAGFSLWRWGSKRRDFPYRKHSAQKIEQLVVPAKKPAVNSSKNLMKCSNQINFSMQHTGTPKPLLTSIILPPDWNTFLQFKPQQTLCLVLVWE